MQTADMIGNCVLQEFKNNPVFLITEEDLKQASLLTESFTPSKKDRKEAERRKKTTGVFRQQEGSGLESWLRPFYADFAVRSPCACVSYLRAIRF